MARMQLDGALCLLINIALDDANLACEMQTTICNFGNTLCNVSGLFTAPPLLPSDGAVRCEGLEFLGHLFVQQNRGVDGNHLRFNPGAQGCQSTASSSSSLSLSSSSSSDTVPPISRIRDCMPGISKLKTLVKSPG